MKKIELSSFIFLLGLCLFFACQEGMQGIVVLKYTLDTCPSEPFFSKGLPDPDKIKFKIKSPDDSEPIIQCQDAIIFPIRIDWSLFGYQNSTLITVKFNQNTSGCDLYLGSGFFSAACKDENRNSKECAEYVGDARARGDTFVREILKDKKSKAEFPATHITTLVSMKSVKDFCAKPLSEWSPSIKNGSN